MRITNIKNIRKMRKRKEGTNEKIQGTGRAKRLDQRKKD